MKLFGFTIIRTKKFDEIELRKWCVEKRTADGGPFRIDIDIAHMYRYIKDGDEAVLQSETLREKYFRLLQENKKLKEALENHQRASSSSDKTNSQG